jgi:hypothetical protein
MVEVPDWGWRLPNELNHLNAIWILLILLGSRFKMRDKLKREQEHENIIHLYKKTNKVIWLLIRTKAFGVLPQQVEGRG